jgi:tetratricopeptide (TPR) repeat protein
MISCGFRVQAEVCGRGGLPPKKELPPKGGSHTALFSCAAGVLLLITAVSVRAQERSTDLPPAIAERFSQGVDALKAGQLDVAETAFRDVVRAGGDRAFVHHNLGIVLRDRGRHADAVAEFRTAIKLDPSFGPARLLAGTSLLALGRVQDARKELENAVRLMPGEILARVQLAEACERLDDKPCVVDAYRKVAALRRDDPEYAYRLGSAYLSLSQWAHEQMVLVAGDSGRRYQALGREYVRQRKTADAVNALEQAAALDPQLPDIHLELARIHWNEGRADAAMREVDRELTIVPFSKAALELQQQIRTGRDRGAASPTIAPELDLRAADLSAISRPVPASAARRTEIDAAIRERDWARAERLLADEIDRLETKAAQQDLLTLIARIFFLDGKPLNAAIALKKADAITPLDNDLRLTLVLAYIRLGRRDWARPELNQLVEAAPNKAEYRYWLGRIDYDDGKYATAIARFKEALERDPASMRSHDNLGLCYEALDDVPTALEHYREAIRLNRRASGKSPWPALNLGILLRQRGELDEADALFREALKYDPESAKAHYELAVLLDQRGQADEALEHLKRATALDSAYPDPYYLLSRIYRRRGNTSEAEAALAAFRRLREARGQPQR